ncbi:zf-HC2 domain-containing protein, partial [Streptomyces sp. CBMA123]|uniref:zf-HC2 domain-containing protein n=1 Tax=Streptomyces sp. CBMA123 TaxID=1896313 RepID=UPI001661CDE7
MTAPLSSPEPSDAHPSVDALADFAEGLIEPAEAARALRRHLDGCAECRETAEALAEVQTLLGAVEPEPMPADVAARLDAALAEAARTDHRVAAEAAERPREAPSAARPTDTPATPVRSVTAPSAPPSRPATASGPGRPRPRRRRFALLLGTAAALAAVGLGGALLLNHPDDSSRSTASAASAPATAAGAPNAHSPHLAGPGTVYREDQLAAQVQQLLAGSGAEPGP